MEGLGHGIDIDLPPLYRQCVCHKAMTAVSITVNGIAGPRCTVDATTEWSIRQVREALSSKLNIPVQWQTLFQGAQKLTLEAKVGSLLEDAAEPLSLSLVVAEVPDPEPTALQEAIEVQDWTVLMQAISQELPEVAVAILARPDFSGVNAKIVGGCTALHGAALNGFLTVCQALMRRPDFTEAAAVTDFGETALQIARRCGHEAVVAFLETVETLILTMELEGNAADFQVTLRTQGGEVVAVLPSSLQQSAQELLEAVMAQLDIHINFHADRLRILKPDGELLDAGPSGAALAVQLADSFQRPS